ncbi:MAG TPA: DUF1223 domain-containing protein [Pseudomonadales bacterium]|nr:DUF1223 domain-containing protein [Pseudomonadales bacterium]
MHASPSERTRRPSPSLALPLALPVVMTLALVLLLILPPAGRAETFESPMARARLVELYTSEGCSSCPPADRWLAALTAGDDLWNAVVPVAFHVTYWDRLGWRDRLAQPDFDARQRRLARSSRAGVYTPGVFLDGDEWRSWRRAAPPASEAEDAGILRARIDGDALHISFRPAAGKVPQSRTLSAEVAWLTGASSEVRRGENAGRRLRHEFAALSLEKHVLVADDGLWRTTVAARRPQSTDSPALAVWVTAADGSLLQATGGWLDATASAPSAHAQAAGTPLP